MLVKRRKFLFVVAGVLGLSLAGAAVAKAVWDSGFYDGYDANLPLEARVDSEEEQPDLIWTRFSFESMPGMRVPAVMARPRDAQGPLPCLVFLHGIGQDKEFLSKIAKPFVDAGFAICSYDQYTRGERKLPKKGVLRDMLELRQRAAVTVIDTRRLVDYLVTRPDVAPDRIYLLGASFGAITGSTAAAFEPRLRAAVLCYGGGHLPTLLYSEAARTELGWLAKPVAIIGAFIMAPADPLLHVAEIAPRPTLFQAGRHDTIVPPASSERLYEAAAQPKEIIWYDSDHVGLDEAHVWRVLDDAIAWVKNQDAPSAGQLAKDAA